MLKQSWAMLGLILGSVIGGGAGLALGIVAAMGGT
jgi:hypothetical protein